MSSSPPSSNMAVTFVDIEKAEFQTKNHSTDLKRFNSAAPTLNNTPAVSRTTSPTRKKLLSQSPTPLPKIESIQAMGCTRPGQAVSSYLNTELDVAYMGAVIITCFFISGIIDAVAFNSWNCFVGMQTGNTVFAGLGLSGLPEAAHARQYIKSFIAIGSFCIGTIFFNVLHRSPTGYYNQPSSRRRIIFMTSFLVQTLFIIVAAALVTVGLVSNQPFRVGQFSSGNADQQGKVDQTHQNYRDLIPIFLLAFEASGQVCLSRVLSLIELPTIVVSTLFHDYTGDLLATRQLWRQSSSVKDFVFIQSRRQNKRLASIIALFMGGVVGGEMYKSKVGMAGALWLAAFLKACIVVAFALWKIQSDDEEE